MTRRDLPLLPRSNLLNGDTIEETVDTGVDDGDLDLDGKRLAVIPKEGFKSVSFSLIFILD